jgi:hypothetical protein
MNKIRQVTLFKSYPDKSWPQFLPQFFIQAGWKFVLRHGWRNWGEALSIVSEIRQSSLVLIWNPSEPGGEMVRRLCRNAAVPFLSLENGLLPQSERWHFDWLGIGSESSLIHNLDWVTPDMLATADRYIAQHFSGKGWAYRGGGGFVLCPLQIEGDVSITLDSPFPTMQSFLDHICRIRPNVKIVARPHPLRKHQTVAGPNIQIITNESTMELAIAAEEVIGINSTVLYETAALGAPTTALARCPVAAHTSPNERRRLIAAAINNQFRANMDDLQRVLAHFGIRL